MYHFSFARTSREQEQNKGDSNCILETIGLKSLCTQSG